MSLKDPSVRPILKWAGGKRQLLGEILPRIPGDMSCYVEPFVGGGAVAFALQPHRAVLNDANEELINVYRCVRDNPDELVERLEEHEAKNSPEYFYTVRALDRRPGYELTPFVDRAARIIYLNRTCFNGLYRVNAAGQFNVPYGRYKHPAIVQKPAIEAMSRYLSDNDVTLVCGDYADVLETLPKDAFVYIDPPYMPVSQTSYFTEYTGGRFGAEEQACLKLTCDRFVADRIGLLQSNSDCQAIRELYGGSCYRIETVRARRAINAKACGRGDINEVLIYNW